MSAVVPLDADTRRRAMNMVWSMGALIAMRGRASGGLDIDAGCVAVADWIDTKADHEIARGCFTRAVESRLGGANLPEVLTNAERIYTVVTSKREPDPGQPPPKKKAVRKKAATRRRAAPSRGVRKKH